jgi:predicted membrane channel-forming protein YqfA (hemolysin III family)
MCISLPQKATTWVTTFDFTDIVFFGIYFTSVIICLLLSSTSVLAQLPNDRTASNLTRFHTVNCHSPEVANFGHGLDLLGIIIFMWGAAIPQIYYGFSDSPGIYQFYWTTASAKIAVPYSLVLTQSPEYYPLLGIRKSHSGPEISCSSLSSVPIDDVYIAWPDRARVCPSWYHS